MDLKLIKDEIIAVFRARWGPKQEYFWSKIEKETATMKTAQNYAKQYSEAMTESITNVLEKHPEVLQDGLLTQEVIDEVLTDPLLMSYQQSSRYTTSAQEVLLNKIGSGAKGLDVEIDGTEAVGRFGKDLVGKETKSIKQAVQYAALSGQSDTVKENAEVMGNLGFGITIVRTYDGVGVHNGKDECEWCLSRCGTFNGYAEAYEVGAFERHPGCGCEIDLITSRGVRRQTDWTTNTWTWR